MQLPAAWLAGGGTSHWCPSTGFQLHRHLPNGKAADCWPSCIRLWQVLRRHEMARNVFAFVPSELGVSKPGRHSCAIRRGSCDVEWLCFLTVSEGLPEPAVLLCAKMLGIYLPYLSAEWSQHSLQCVRKTFRHKIPYIWLCWVSAAFLCAVHSRHPCVCGKNGHGT